MKRFFLPIALSLFATETYAQDCMAVDDAIEYMADAFGGEIKIIGKSGAGYMAIFVNEETGYWQVVIVSNENACGMFYGEEFTVVASGEPT